jgi:hypothetical protein
VSGIGIGIGIGLRERVGVSGCFVHVTWVACQLFCQILYFLIMSTWLISSNQGEVLKPEVRSARQMHANITIVPAHLIIIKCAGTPVNVHIPSCGKL